MAKRNWVRTAYRVLAAAAILSVVFWFIPFTEIVHRLAAARLGYASVGVLFTVLSDVVDANQLRLLLKRSGLPTSLWTVFETKMVSRFYGQFMAGELLGSAVKLQRLAGPGRKWPEVLAAMAYLRLMNTSTLVLMGIVFVAIERPAGAGRWAGAVLIVMFAALVGLQLLLAGAHGERIAALHVLRRVRGSAMEKLRAIGRTAIESYRLFSETIWSTCLQAMIRHTLGLASFACLALSLDIQLSVLTIGWIRVVLQAVLMLPITVSGLGLREGTLVILLQDYGVSAAAAVALSFMVLAVRLLKNGLGGLLEARSLLLPARAAKGQAP